MRFRKKPKIDLETTLKRILSNEWCPFEDICNYGKKCDDVDWINCGIYINIKKLFDYNQTIQDSKLICD